MRNEIEATTISSLWFILFAVILMGVLYFLLFRIIRKKKNVRRYGFLQLMAGLNPLETASISLLTIRLMYYFWCFTQIKTTVLFLVVFLTIGVIYNLINRKFGNLIVDALNCLLLYAVIFAKNIFYGYLIDVAVVWHVVVFLVLLIVFGVLYAVFFYLRDVKGIVVESNRRLYRKK